MKPPWSGSGKSIAGTESTLAAIQCRAHHIVPIIRRAEDGAYELCEARWGLIPNWWKKAHRQRLPSTPGVKRLRSNLPGGIAIATCDASCRHKAGTSGTSERPRQSVQAKAEPQSSRTTSTVSLLRSSPLPGCSHIGRRRKASCRVMCAIVQGCRTSIVAIHDRMPLSLPLNPLRTGWLLSGAWKK